MDGDYIRLLLKELSSGSNHEDENDSDVGDNVKEQEEMYDTEQEDDNKKTSEVEHSESSREFEKRWIDKV